MNGEDDAEGEAAFASVQAPVPVPLRLTAEAEVFPLAATFRISREARTEAKVVLATLTDGTNVGRGECVPYARYGESVDSVLATIEEVATRVAAGISREELRAEMKAGAARNAIDCALWDFEAKRAGTSVARMLGIEPAPLTTCFTISLGEPEEMAAAARAAGRPVLKIKLGRNAGDPERIRAVRTAVPDARLLVDANEGWPVGQLLLNLSACAEAGVELVEQPLAAGRDGTLATISHPVSLCADESCHTSADLATLATRYDAVNVKLDKAGGLTEALAMIDEARALGLKVMVGCMVGTSLGMAPALLAAQRADFVDLDGPLLLARDREYGLNYDGGTVMPALQALWG